MTRRDEFTEGEIEAGRGVVLHFHFTAWQLECVRATPGKVEAPSPGMECSADERLSIPNVQAIAFSILRRVFAMRRRFSYSVLATANDGRT